MAKELSLGAVEYLNPGGKNPSMFEGDEVEGVFIETRIGGKYKSKSHTLKQRDGSLKILSGSGQVNKIMATVQIGTPLRIRYESKSIIKSGEFKGSEAFNFRVFDITDEYGDTGTPLSAPKQVVSVEDKVKKVYDESKA